MTCTSCQIAMLKFHEIILDRDQLITVLQRHGVLPETVECPNCRRPCKFYPDNSFRFKCTSTQIVSENKRKKKKVICPFSVSARKGTFFDKSKLSLEVICKFVAFWLVSSPPRHTLLMNEFDLSSITITDWCSFCRDVCFACIVDVSEPIGGPNKVVEIHEAKLEKRKNSRGRGIEGQWAFGGIERESNKCFLVSVYEKGKDTLLEVIQSWVLPGTTIISDCWKVYDCLEDEDFRAEMVNSSKNFLVPDNRARTQSMERLGRSRALQFGRQESRCAGHLAECLFMMKYSNHKDRFHPFFVAMGRVYPLAESDSGETSEYFS